jgi:ribosomal protein S18 acetylase RimI-like enzyme
VISTEVRAMTLQAELINAQTPRHEPWDFDVLLAADWRELRATRLRALRESPHAFVATYAEEVALGEKQWRSRLRWTTWMVARLDGETIGLARLRRPDEELSDVRYIESVWIDPAHRRKGLARAMMEELESYARNRTITQLRLWVLDTNPLAWKAYIELGFAPEQGEQDVQDTRKRTSSGTRVKERRMSKDIRPPLLKEFLG